MQESQKMTVAKDTVVYMLAKVAEAVLGVLTLSAYSHFFLPELNGRYDLVNKAIVIIAPICALWLQQGAARYVNTCEAENDTKPFYSTVVFTWLAIAAAVLCVGGGGLLLVTNTLADKPAVKGFLETFRPGWLWLALGCILTYSAAQIVASLAGAKRRIALSLCISLFSAAVKLIVPVTLSALFGARVEWILLTLLLCDGAAAVFGSIRLGLWKHVKLSAYSKRILSLFAVFGVPLIGNFITTTVLNASDRFLIASIKSAEQNGVYGSNYAIASAAITALTMGVSRGSYPNILKAWGVKDDKLALQLISQAVRLFLLITLPAAAGLSVLAPRITGLLLAEAYHGGAGVIPWVSFGLLFLGLTEYSNKHWELSAQTRVIFRNSAISGGVNILLNIIFLPRFGYMAAAASTFLGFLLYFLLSKLESRKYMRWTLPWACYARIGGAAAAMAAAVYALSRILPGNWYWLVALIGLGVVVYGGILCATGELAPEVRYIRNQLTRKKA